MRTIDWRRMWLATQIFLGLMAVMALAIWFLEPFGWAWRTASAIVLAAIWWLIFKLCPAGLSRVERRAAKHGIGALRASGNRAPAAMPAIPTLSRPPKSARHTYVLTESGVPVGVEYDRRAVDNWISLGDEHDAVAYAASPAAPPELTRRPA